MSKDVHVLIHGQICTMSEDELMHWKYIKREKQPDGSYKYYYDESELTKLSNTKAAVAAETKEAQNRYGKAKNASFNAEIRRANAEKQAEKYKKAYLAGDMSALEKYKKYSDEAKAAQVEKDAYDAEASKANADIIKAAKKGEALAEKLKKKTVSSFVERTVSRGIVAVTDALRKLFGKKDTPRENKAHGIDTKLKKKATR